MQKCRHCGKENGDDVDLCSACGLELGDSRLQRATSQSWKRRKRFFRWQPASMALIVLGVLYGVVAPLMLWLSRDYSHSGDQHLARLCFWSACWYAVIAVLCIVARQSMRCPTRAHLLIGALVATAALLIVTWSWANSLRRGDHPWPALEPLLIWPPLIYAIIFALRERGKDHAAQPGAPPNDGPATPVTNSEATAGPSSVS